MENLSKAQLRQLSELLLTHKSQLEQLLGGQQLQAQPVILDQQAVGRVSRIDAIQCQEMAKANKRHTEQHLKAIDDALRRLADENYGFCEGCGQPIAAARLKIKPEAELCISCQGSHE
jgi:DnaK suppressor protein